MELFVFYFYRKQRDATNKECLIFGFNCYRQWSLKSRGYDKFLDLMVINDRYNSAANRYINND